MGTASWATLLATLLPVAGGAGRTDRVTSPADPPSVPERYRLPAGPFAVEVRQSGELSASGVVVYQVTFPSAVATAHAENNLVRAELFWPKRAAPSAPVPAAAVFDILDGAGVVSRGQAAWLASRGVACLCVTLPYYGERRPPSPPAPRIRFVSPDIAQSLENVRQGVLDGRRGLQWLAGLPGVDPARICVVGTSLGSFVGGVTAACEPSVSRVCLLLGGGGLVDAFAAHPKVAGVLPLLALVGVTPDSLRPVIAPADPLTYAEQLKAKRLLLIGASRDDVVPPQALTRLWEATGRPKIVWYDATHTGAGAFAFAAMREIEEHLTAPAAPVGAAK